jgi:hypothetical protein
MFGEIGEMAAQQFLLKPANLLMGAEFESGVADKGVSV